MEDPIFVNTGRVNVIVKSVEVRHYVNMERRRGIVKIVKVQIYVSIINIKDGVKNVMVEHYVKHYLVHREKIKILMDTVVLVLLIYFRKMKNQ